MRLVHESVSADQDLPLRPIIACLGLFLSAGLDQALAQGGIGKPALDIHMMATGFSFVQKGARAGAHPGPAAPRSGCAMVAECQLRKPGASCPVRATYSV